MKKLIAVTLAAASISMTAALPTFARTEVYLDFAPPEAPYEAVPAPRAGFIWVPGYYEHDNGKYHWRAGRWEGERHGYAYHGATWEHRDGHYYYREGGWHQEHSPG
ncbi:MAG TPA: hypothetical protein VGI57_11085 [Usitatibacter sp.]|jgi:hypothetical protein